MRFQVVPAAYVIFRRGEEVLLQLRQNTGYHDGHWATAAAGHVEQGESVIAAAVREAYEELGVGIDETDLVPLTVMHRTGARHAPVDERVDFFFVCRSWEGEPRRMEPDKASALEWFPLGALPTPVVPHELAVLSSLGSPADLPLVLPYGF